MAKAAWPTFKSAEVPTAIGAGNGPGISQPYHRQIVIRRRSDYRCADDFAAGETNRYLPRSAHYVIVGHDVPGPIPNEAGSGLLTNAFAFHIGRVGCRRCSDHLNH